MKSNSQKVNHLTSIAYVLVLTLVMSCQKSIDRTPAGGEAVAGKEPKSLKEFEQVNLVGNNDEYQPAHIDPNLINGWGISFSSGGTAWVSAEGTGKSGVYNSEGVAAGISPVSIPSPTATTGGHPTGQVFNSSRGFRLPNGNPARFIFAGDDGVISGWNGGPAAIRKITDPGEAYLGITLARNGADSFLYVANFSENEIEVYDTAWHQVNMEFEDKDLPAGYAPFNIQNIDNKLYVMYAKVGSDGEEEVGPGNGYVDVYNPGGTLMKRFVSRGQLNAPWGVAKAHAGFFGDSGQESILVGNFGDGHINAYSMDGEFLGQLRSHGNPLIIEGLWAISFPPGTSTINPNRLYFAAGPDDEQAGLFGYIIKSE